MVLAAVSAEFLTLFHGVVAAVLTEFILESGLLQRNFQFFLGQGQGGGAADKPNLLAEGGNLLSGNGEGVGLLDVAASAKFECSIECHNILSSISACFFAFNLSDKK